MTTLEHDSISETLDEGATALLQRGPRSPDGNPVIIKRLRGGAPSPRAVERLWHAYMIVCQIDSPFVSKPERVSAASVGRWLRAAQGPAHSSPSFAEEDRACTPSCS